nr:tetratricopeptide repeat protein [uncultured Olsenella sp.]
MARKPGPTSKKRLAKAKPAAASDGGKATAAGTHERRAARKGRVTAIVVGVFAVLMALSMMLPSLAAIFSPASSSKTADASQSQASSDSSSQDQSSGDSATDSAATGIDAVNARYQKDVDELKARLDSDPKGLATLLNLGNDYMSWAYASSSYATSDDQKAQVAELWKSAISYYDQYLEQKDSNAVRVNRALCQLYSGDTDAARAALEELTAAQPDYGPAWANLGMVYEAAGESDSAREAYQKAEEKDANDEYGAKSYAQRRLAAMDAAAKAADSGSTSGSGTSGQTGATGTSSGTTTQGLSDVLASRSGTSL